MTTHKHIWVEEVYGYVCTTCGMVDAYDDDVREYEYPEQDDEYEFDCGWMRGMGCSKAGSEECDWECPDRRNYEKGMALTQARLAKRAKGGRMNSDDSTLRADIAALCIDRDRALAGWWDVCAALEAAQIRIRDLEAERDAAREALVGMVVQYMEFREGYVSHEFMSAQEDAIDYLETIGWLTAGALERYYWTPASGRAGAKEGAG